MTEPGREPSPGEAIAAAKLRATGFYGEILASDAESIIDVLHAAGYLLMQRTAFDPYQQITDATGFSTTSKVKP